ncbi:hypothetical protein [Komagataeibacter europaeus]|uniref:hypothetical protein n=1 Tax=Komagataeibacter europaeus TaxID=33995 RepID=UPI00128F7BDA|nr:hypothetical protein [Komagataeibacter europaeus]
MAHRFSRSCWWMAGGADAGDGRTGGGSPAGDGRRYRYRPVRPAARGGLAERARECAEFEHRFPRSRQVYGTIAMPGF